MNDKEKLEIKLAKMKKILEQMEKKQVEKKKAQIKNMK